MLRKFAMVTTLAAAVLSSISGNTVQAEVFGAITTIFKYDQP